MAATAKNIGKDAMGPQVEDLAVLKAVLSATKDGFVFQNMNGEIVDYNDAACRILRMTPDQLIGKTSLDPEWEAVREDGSPFPGELHPIVITLSTGKACYDIIMGIRSQSKDMRWIRVSSVMVQNSQCEMIGAVATFSDITSEILMKKALARSADTQEGAMMAARLRLHKLIFDLSEPGHSLAAHLAMIKQSLQGQTLPEDAATSLNRLEAASESLMHLLYQLSLELPDCDGAVEPEVEALPRVHNQL